MASEIEHFTFFNFIFMHNTVAKYKLEITDEL